MNKWIVFIAFFIICLPSCKLFTNSRTKSFVGLEADVDPKNAPTFKLLKEWFNGKLEIVDDAKTAGSIRYPVNATFTTKTFESLPPQFIEAMNKYVISQDKRVAAFQSSKTSSKIKELIKKETEEMSDIILCLLDPAYSPQTDDLLAKLVHTPALRNYVNRYASGFMSKAYKNRPLDEIKNSLEIERESFEKNLTEAYVDGDGPSKKLLLELDADCTKLKMLSEQFSKARVMLPPHKFVCSSGPSPLPSKESASNDVALILKNLGGPVAQVFNIAAGISAPGGYAVAASSGKTRLKIFGNRDPDAGAPEGVSPPSDTRDFSRRQSQDENRDSSDASNRNSNGNDNTSRDEVINDDSKQMDYANDSNRTNYVPRPNPMPFPDQSGILPNNYASFDQNQNIVNALLTILAPLLTKGPKSSTGINLALDGARGETHSYVKNSNVDCSGLTGMQLITCRQSIESLLPTGSFSQRTATLTPSPGSENFSLNEESGYNFYMISKFGTPVQNQGREGACSAFGLAQTMEILGTRYGLSGRYDAWKIWEAQSRQADMFAALRAASTVSGFDAKIVKSDQFKPSIGSLKQVLNQGRPVYFGSDVDTSWRGNYVQTSEAQKNLTCDTQKNFGAHAYSIVGYDEGSRIFIVRNSWGDAWGEQGYGYLPYDCIGNQGWATAFDVDIKAK